MTFGEKIRELRKAQEISQRDLADTVRIDYSYLSKIENNSIDFPSDVVIKQLAIALNADVQELLDLAPRISRAEIAEATRRNPGIGFIVRRLTSLNLTSKQVDQITNILKETE